MDIGVIKQLKVMTTADIKRLGLILALQAEIEAAKADNQYRMLMGQTPSYNEDWFYSMAEKLREIIYKHDEQL